MVPLSRPDIFHPSLLRPDFHLQAWCSGSSQRLSFLHHSLHPPRRGAASRFHPVQAPGAAAALLPWLCPCPAPGPAVVPQTSPLCLSSLFLSCKPLPLQTPSSAATLFLLPDLAEIFPSFSRALLLPNPHPRPNLEGFCWCLVVCCTAAELQPSTRCFCSVGSFSPRLSGGCGQPLSRSLEAAGQPPAQVSRACTHPGPLRSKHPLPPRELVGRLGGCPWPAHHSGSDTPRTPTRDAAVSGDGGSGSSEPSKCVTDRVPAHSVRQQSPHRLA